MSGMTEMVQRRMGAMLVGSLRYYANEASCEEEEESAERLRAIADRIEQGNATEQDWLDAIDETDMSEWYDKRFI